MPASSFVAWAGSPVIGVTRVTEPDRTNVSATSRAPIPATPDSVSGLPGLLTTIPAGCNPGNPRIHRWGSPD
jgi:hypothetical protein